MEINEYTEKPRTIEAVLVTDENIADAVEWATGQRNFRTGEYTEEFGHTYIFDLPPNANGARSGVQMHAGDYLVSDFKSVYPLSADYFERRWQQA